MTYTENKLKSLMILTNSILNTRTLNLQPILCFFQTQPWRSKKLYSLSSIFQAIKLRNKSSITWWLTLVNIRAWMNNSLKFWKIRFFLKIFQTSSNLQLTSLIKETFTLGLKHQWSVTTILMRFLKKLWLKSIKNVTDKLSQISK